jgi:hypothetical protein
MMALVMKAVALLVIAIFVVKGAEDSRWKLINFGVIAGAAVLGLWITVLIEYLNDSQSEQAIAVSIVCAYVGAGVARAGNYWRLGGIRKGKGARYPLRRNGYLKEWVSIGHFRLLHCPSGLYLRSPW